MALQTVTGLKWIDMETKFAPGLAWITRRADGHATMSFNLPPTPTYDTGGATSTTP